MGDFTWHQHLQPSYNIVESISVEKMTQIKEDANNEWVLNLRLMSTRIYSQLEQINVIIRYQTTHVTKTGLFNRNYWITQNKSSWTLSRDIIRLMSKMPKTSKIL